MCIPYIFIEYVCNHSQTKTDSQKKIAKSTKWKKNLKAAPNESHFFQTRVKFSGNCTWGKTIPSLNNIYLKCNCISNQFTTFKETYQRTNCKQNSQSNSTFYAIETSIFKLQYFIFLTWFFWETQKKTLTIFKKNWEKNLETSRINEILIAHLEAIWLKFYRLSLHSL